MNAYRAPFSVFLAALTILLISSHDTAASKLHNYSESHPRDIEYALELLELRDVDPQQHLSITLWSSEDAESRLENIRRASLARNNPDLTHIGVNLTDSEDIFNAYLLRDNLAGDSLQLHASGAAANNLMNTYGYRTISR